MYATVDPPLRSTPKKKGHIPLSTPPRKQNINILSGGSENKEVHAIREGW